MPYSRPSLSSLRSQVQGDIDGNLPGLDTLLRYANLRALGAASAGVANGCYGYLDYIAKQSNPFTATGEALAAWGALKNVYLKEATAASGAITFAATAGTTTPIPAGTTITRADGATFTTTAAASPSGTSVIVQATATTAGAAGNTAAGTAMYLSVGLSGITPNGSVSTAFTGGADVETQDDFKSRVLVAYQEEPSGGSVTDYENWALAVSGVTRAWCVARAYGPGTVVVLFMMDEVRAAENGFPQGTNGVATSETRDTAATGDQLLVANALFSEEPAEALVYAFTPTPNTITLTISGLASAGSTVQAAVQAAFASAVTSKGAPGGTLDLSDIEAAIAAVSGAAGFVITAVAASAGTVTPGPTGNITSNALALPAAGAITFV